MKDCIDILDLSTEEIDDLIHTAIDMMDSDERGLYFLTAKGKGIYQRLKRTGYISLTAME